MRDTSGFEVCFEGGIVPNLQVDGLPYVLESPADEYRISLVTIQGCTLSEK